MLGKEMNLETPHPTTKHLPKEDIIQIPPEEKYFIGTFSQDFVEAQNPRISFNHSCQFENKIFEAGLEGFVFCLSPDSLCLQESEYQIVEDLY